MRFPVSTSDRQARLDLLVKRLLEKNKRPVDEGAMRGGAASLAGARTRPTTDRQDWWQRGGIIAGGSEGPAMEMCVHGPSAMHDAHRLPHGEYATRVRDARTGAGFRGGGSGCAPSRRRRIGPSLSAPRRFPNRCSPAPARPSGHARGSDGGWACLHRRPRPQPDRQVRA